MQIEPIAYIVRYRLKGPVSPTKLLMMTSIKYGYSLHFSQSTGPPIFYQNYRNSRATSS